MVSQDKRRAEATSAYVQVWSFIVFDVFWLSNVPSASLAGLALGMILQSNSLRRTLRCSDTFEVTSALAMTLWGLGNAVWSFTEFVWDGKTPAGFLERVPLVHRIEHSWNPGSMMMVSVVVIAASVAVSVMYYFLVVLRPCWPQRFQACLRRVLVGRSQDARNMPLEEDYVVPGAARRSLYIVPWLVLDLVWAVGNYLSDHDVLPDGDYSGPYAVMCSAAGIVAAFGLLALYLGAVSAVQEARSHRLSTSCMILGESLWIAANVIWALDDLLTDGNGYWPEILSVVTFFLSGALFVASFVTRDVVDEHPGVASGTLTMATNMYSRESLSTHLSLLSGARA